MGKPKGSKPPSLNKYDSVFFQPPDPVASFTPAPQDDSYLQYASDKTRENYDKADDKGKAAILMNVNNKYKPVVDALEVQGGIFDLIDQLQDCNIGPPPPTMPPPMMDTTQGGRRKKMRGGDLAAVKAALKKLWVEIVTATFTPDNILKAFPVALIAGANPTLAGSLFTAAKTAVGAAAGVCLTNAGITAISVGALVYLYDVKIDINSLNMNAADKATLTALRDDLKKNLKPGGKFGSVAQPTQALLDKVEKIRNDQAAAAKAADDKAKAAAIAAELEKTSKEVAAISDPPSKQDAAIAATAAPLNANAPPFVSANPNAASVVTPKTGGRRTKKGGKKKMRKTRRPARVFKY